MADRLVRGVCPHDCPDGCAMLVTVDGEGRATHVTGDPEHPITAGFLCGKVSNYLDRVYAEDRLLEPLIRTGAKGEGRFRRASWDEALDLMAGGLRAAIAAHGGETVLPYFYLGEDGLPAAQLDERAGVQRARGERPGADDLRERGHGRGAPRPTAPPQRSIPSAGRARATSCAGAGTRCRPRRTCGGCSSPRAGRARKLVVVDPFRSRTARVADEHLRPLPGTDAALGAGDDARDRGRRAAGRGLVPGAHDGLRRAARAAGRAPRRALRRGVRRARGGHRPDRARVRGDAAVAAAPRRRRAAPPGRPDRLPDARLPARARRAHGGTRAAAARTSRRPRSPRHRRRARAAPPRPPARPGARGQHVPARPGARGRRPRPAGDRAGVLEREPRGDRAGSGAGARRPAPRRPVLRRAGAVHDGHGPPRRRRAARHDPARAPRRRLVVGPPLCRLQRAGDRAARPGEGQHGDLPPARRPPGPRRPVLPRERRADARGAVRAAARRRRAGRAAAAGLASRSTSDRAARRTRAAASAPRTAGSPSGPTGSPTRASIRCRSTTRRRRRPARARPPAAPTRSRS